MGETKGIFFKATNAQKQQIDRLAKICGLPKGEYILLRSLGYEPKPVPSDDFFRFYDKLTELLNLPLSTETEKAALTLFDEISAKYLDQQKQAKDEIKEEVTAWQKQDSGP